MRATAKCRSRQHACSYDASSTMAKNRRQFPVAKAARHVIANLASFVANVRTPTRLKSPANSLVPSRRRTHSSIDTNLPTRSTCRSSSNPNSAYALSNIPNVFPSCRSRSAAAPKSSSLASASRSASLVTARTIMRSSNAQHLPHATGSSANNPCIAKSCRTARSRSSQNAFALASAFADADADALVDARRASSSARNKWSTVRSHASSVRTRAASSVPATTVRANRFTILDASASPAPFAPPRSSACASPRVARARASASGHIASHAPRMATRDARRRTLARASSRVAAR